MDSSIFPDHGLQTVGVRRFQFGKLAVLQNIGISSFGLGQDLGISRKEAEAYIQQYFETYPGILSLLV